jgi:hypothetical protein
MSLTIQDIKTFTTTLSKASLSEDEIYFELDEAFRNLIIFLIHPSSTEKVLKAQTLRDHRADLKKLEISDDLIDKLISSLEEYEKTGISEIKHLICEEYEIAFPEKEGVFSDRYYTIVMKYLKDEKGWETSDRLKYGLAELQEQYKKEKALNSRLLQNENPAQTQSVANTLQSEGIETPVSSNVDIPPPSDSFDIEFKLEIAHLKEIVSKLNNAPKDSEHADVIFDLKIAFQSLFKSFFTYNNVLPVDLLSVAILKSNEQYLVETLNVNQISFDALVQSLTRSENGAELKNLISKTFEISFNTFSADAPNVAIITYLLCDNKDFENDVNYRDRYAKLKLQYEIDEHNKMFLRHTVPVDTLMTDELGNNNSAATDSNSAADEAVKIQDTSVSSGSISSTSEPTRQMTVNQALGNDNSASLESKNETHKLTIAGILDFYKKIDAAKQRKSDIKMIYDAFKNLINSFFEKDKPGLLSADLIQVYKDDLLSIEISLETIEALENSLRSQPDGSEIQKLIFDEYKLIMPEDIYAFSYTTVVCGLLEGKNDYELGTFLGKLRPSSQEPVDQQNPDILDLSKEIPASSSSKGHESQSEINAQPTIHNNDNIDNNSRTFVSSAIPVEGSQNITNNPKTPREFLLDLRKNIMRYEHWSVQGFSFLGSKTPRYIKHLQFLLKDCDNILGLEENAVKSLTVAAVKELILAKDSDSLLRGSEARNTYNSYLVKGLSVLATTEKNFRNDQKLSQPEELFRVSIASSRSLM